MTVKELFSLLPDEGGSGYLSFTGEDESVLGIIVFAKGQSAQDLNDLYQGWDAEDGDTMK